MNVLIKNLSGFLFSAAFFAVTLAPSTCHGHAGDVHKQITQSAFNSPSGRANFLSENPVTQNLTASPPQCSGSRTPMDWLQQGSYYEDEQTYDLFEKVIGKSPRCFDHFYTVRPQRTPGLVDGLTDWSEPPLLAYLISGCTVNNSFVWGTQSGIQGPLDVGYNFYKWSDARTNELAALTNSTPEARNASMAMMFYSLGHVLHLNQDTSSPDHVRDAAHMLTAWFENYAVREDSPNMPNYRKYTNWFALPQNAPVGWTDWQAQGFTNLLNFWDRNYYLGNSSQGLKDDADNKPGAKLGLAEFCNGNFLGETALYNECYNDGDKHKFPFPSFYNSTSYKDDPTKNGLIASIRPTTLLNGDHVNKFHFDKNYDGIKVTNHSAGAFLGIATALRSPRATQVLSLSPPLQQVSLSICDDDVLKTYHDILLPKAVEYSAGILDYYFRGTMDVMVSWGGTNAPNFTNTVQNTSGQDFHGGMFYLFQETNGIRSLIGTNDWAGNTLTNGTSTDFICCGSPTNKLVLVYQGTIGWTNNTAQDPVDENIAIAVANPHFEQVITYNYHYALTNLGLANGATIITNLESDDFFFVPNTYEVIVEMAYFDDDGAIGCDTNGTGGISAPLATNADWPHTPLTDTIIPSEDVTVTGKDLSVNITATDVYGVDIGWVDVIITWLAWPAP